MFNSNIFSVILIISFIIGFKLVTTNKKENKYVYLAMGDYLTSVEDSYSDIYYRNNDKVDKYNKFLSRKSMTSGELLRFLSIDAAIIYDGVNKSISNVIKESDMITISIGYNDVMNNVRYNSITNKYLYDNVVLDRVMSILQSNLYEIVSQIYEYNDNVDVFVLSSYYPYPSVVNAAEELFYELNSSIKEACQDSGAIFVDINGVSNIEYFDK